VFDEPLTVAEDDAVLRLSGSVDEAAIAELRLALDDAVRRGAVRYVDVSRIDLLPSAGLGLLAAARSAASRGGRDLDVVAADGTYAQKVLDAVGLPHLTALPD
jgi:anti-anti-sigma factor